MRAGSAGSSQLKRIAPLAAVRAVAIVLLGSFLAGSVGAQQSESVRLGVSLKRNSLAPRIAARLSVPLADTSESRLVRASRGALIGAGIGAAAGLVTALVATQQSSDHSEDAIAYVYLPALGAFIGLVIGGVVGMVRN